MRVGRKWVPEPCDIHHTNGGNNHLETYGNCPWHHRGVPKCDLRAADMALIFGPSMAERPHEYRERYGSEADILASQKTMLLKSVEQLTEQNNGSRKRQDHQGHRLS